MAGLSYGQVRQYVLSELGGEAVNDESRLELLMQAALVEISNELDIVREQRLTSPYVLTAGSQAYSLPTDCSRPIELRFEGRPIPRQAPLRDKEEEAQLDVNGLPAFWWEDVDNHTFVVEPAVEDETTVMLEYISTVDATLYDLNQSGQRVWRWIALPEEVHFSFVKYCTGQAMLRSDPGLAAMYVNSALGEIRAWKFRKARSVNPVLVLNLDASRQPRSMDQWENDAVRFRPYYS